MEDDAEKLGLRKAMKTELNSEGLCGACGEDPVVSDRDFQTRFCTQCGARFKKPIIRINGRLQEVQE